MMLSQLGDGVITTDTTGRVTFLNPAAEALTGWSDGQARTEMLDTVFNVVDSVSRLRVTSPPAGPLRNGAIVSDSNHSILIGRDGIEHAVHDSATSVMDDAGQACGVVLIFRDITEPCVMERQIVAQAASLAEMHRRKHAFLAVLCHEMRAPIAPIANAAHLLALTEGPIVRDACAIIERQLARLTQLVDDLMDVTHVNSGRIVLRVETTDVRLVVDRAVTSVRAIMEKKAHTMHVVVPDFPVLLKADPVRLEQVLVNLLSNAAHDTPFGGAVTLTLTQEEHECVFRVRDTGVGIAPVLLGRTFDLFTQAERWFDNSDGRLSTGLAMVHGLVTLHGGRVDVQSTLGVGSEFSVHIPSDVSVLSPPREPLVQLTSPPASVHHRTDGTEHIR